MTYEDCHIITYDIHPHNVTTVECILCRPEAKTQLANDHINLTVEGNLLEIMADALRVTQKYRFQ